MSALVCITTCKRLPEVKKNIIPFLQFCHSNDSYDFLMALDGHEKEYIEFCDKYDIPLIHSDEREGVGISKNRVLAKFPDYKYYFFIEDDVELIEPKIFDFHINLSKDLNLPHLTIATMIRERIIKREKFNKTIITHASKAGAYFSFYTKEGLQKVGGWHEVFAKYKRFGHTEHSYRYFHTNLLPAPFVLVEAARKYIILNSPPHVTKVSVKTNKNQLIDEEQALIDSKNKYYPIKTFSDYYFNGKNTSISKLNPILKKRYSLISGNTKRKALGNYYLHKFMINKNPLLILLALVLYPNNGLIRFYLKKKIGLWRIH